ncbi:MAG: ATP-binding protein [Candidatus Latescibacteria bacterium]|nr:ATP-binding protein [Candidatus Latescibacterota bacterium]
MKELTVISGKGGTGKTSIVASFAALAQNVVLADCDVDAADLHLVLKPTIKSKKDFSGGSIARIKSGYCVACGKCEELCMFDAVFFDGPGNGTYPKTYRIDPIYCEGCGVCAWFCAENAIEFKPAINGQWFISETKHGPMVHAKLGPAEENSGKLVTLVRNAAKEIAERNKSDMVIIDGSPGIGCPVIASVTGADMVLAVTEPTVSGLHDLNRVLELTEHFKIPTAVVINKWDINEEMSWAISNTLKTKGVDMLGKIRYDIAFTGAMVHETTVVEYTKSPVAEDIKNLWNNVNEKMKTISKGV